MGSEVCGSNITSAQCNASRVTFVVGKGGKIISYCGVGTINIFNLKTRQGNKSITIQLSWKVGFRRADDEPRTSIGSTVDHNKNNISWNKIPSSKNWNCCNKNCPSESLLSTKRGLREWEKPLRLPSIGAPGWALIFVPAKYCTVLPAKIFFASRGYFFSATPPSNEWQTRTSKFFQIAASQ